ncbi:uncharacterized protein LOC121384475 isoform X2 [Gigantopelta aegis]|nr:uncharacterized protein LOC121384471 isoform X2 [Gigantopelta aegis]XP_041370817.1 uncharacterized protein LOC121384475 isoform X2 [Gigantopelta aegis]
MCLLIVVKKSHQEANPEQSVWHEARFSDLIADIVASSREGCELGAELAKKLLRTRVLRSKRLQKLVKRQARLGNITVLDKTLNTSSIELSLNENLHLDYEAIQKYSQLLITVRRNARIARRTMRQTKNKLRNLADQLRQAMTYRGERPLRIQGVPGDVRSARDRRRAMDEVEKAINDYAIIREIAGYLNKMSVLYPMYNEYVQRLESGETEC